MSISMPLLSLTQEVDLGQVSLSNTSISYESAIKPYCDAGALKGKNAMGLA